jgi:TolA-binding protein
MMPVVRKELAMMPKAASSKPTTTASSARGNNPELQKIASELREVMTDLQKRISEMQSIANTRFWLGGLLDFTAMEQDLRDNQRRLERLLQKVGADGRKA